MVCEIESHKTPKLKNPVLIEGLPGIGFVANIAALHLIQELKAKLFARIHSSSFQDFAITSEKGKTRSPVNELYYYKGKNQERDLIILYGNTQALTTFGQYELCGRILDIAEQHKCNRIITLGGLRKDEEIASPPQLYCAATDTEALNEALSLGAKILGGQIFGIAGLLIGLSKLRGISGFCLLAETQGYYPDVNAARETLKATCKMLNIQIDLTRLDMAAEETRTILESFGLLEAPSDEKRKRETQYRWIV